GGSAGVPAANGQAPASMTEQSVIGPQAPETPASGPTSLRGRLRRLFSPGHAEEATDQAIAPGTQAQPIPQAVPTGAASQLGPITPPRPDMQISQKDLDRIGHEQDYTWVTGRLVRTASGGQC